MGVVYEARDVKLKRRVAIKLLHGTTRDVADRFLIEARATARCTHENIVVIHEVDEHDGAPYMVLELVEGRSLREVMRSQALDATRVVDLILPVARALQRAHGLGIVHRDLKPENVLVTDAGQVKVLDFGIAKALGDNGESSVDPSRSAPPEGLQQTADGAIVGTLPYMAPEQMGVAPIDHRTDLWALGIIAFELLAGRHPIQPLTNEALIENLLGDEPMTSARTLPGVSAPLADLIDACLAKQKTARIADAATLVRRLEGLRAERHFGELAPVPAVAPPPRRSRRWIAAIAGVLLVGGIATAALVLRDRNSDQATPPISQSLITPQPITPPPSAPQPITPPPSALPAADHHVQAPPADASDHPPASSSAPAAKPAATPKIRPKPSKPRTRPTPAVGSGSGSAKPCSIYTERVGC